MELSNFGQKFRDDCGILTLMDDLGKAAQQAGTIMLGGGNPSMIPEVGAYFRQQMVALLNDGQTFESMVGTYDGPEGTAVFIQALADFFKAQYGWSIGPENIVLTNGSQTAFFLLFNALAGEGADGSFKKILLPLAPEYIGYGDVGLKESLFVSYRPQIEILDGRLFKYKVDFEALEIGPDISAICVSRPTNPTGNVLTEREIQHLSQLAQKHKIPLIIDNAYGLPFPGIIFSEATPHWEPHHILSMSLSKIGLPGTRTGILIANEEIIDVIKGMNGVISLAPNSFGAQLATKAVQSGDILNLSREVIRPHYEKRAWQVVEWYREGLAGLDFYIHKPEGAIFVWLWFKGLPISNQTLYERLKERGVVVVSGQHFFPGLEEPWQHKHECIRMSYAADMAQVKKGVQIICEEVRRCYEVAPLQEMSGNSILLPDQMLNN